MLILKNYVRTCNDPEFQQLQQISHMHPNMYSKNPELSREFRQLAGILFILILYWSSEEIYPNTYSL